MNQLKTSPDGTIIPYEAWEKYWKPLADNYEQLKNDHTQLEADKSVTVRLDMHTSYMSHTDHGSRYTSIGVINPAIRIGDWVPFELDKVVLKQRVRDLIDLEKTDHYRNRMYSTEDIENLIRINDKKISELQNISLRIASEYTKIGDAISGLPRIIRWLTGVSRRKAWNNINSTCK